MQRLLATTLLLSCLIFVAKTQQLQDLEAALTAYYKKGNAGMSSTQISTIASLIMNVTQPGGTDAFLNYIPSLSETAQTMTEELVTVYPALKTLVTNIYDLYYADLNPAGQAALNATIAQLEAGTVSYEQIYLTAKASMSAAKFKKAQKKVTAKVKAFEKKYPSVAILAKTALKDLATATD